MIKLLVFDKDGVLLSLTATWLPVIEAVAAHTISRLPDGNNTITSADLLALIGVDAASGQIDPGGVFARDSFAAIQSVWQKHLPAAMFDLQSDRGYQAEIEALMLKLVRGKSVAKGDIKTPLGNLYAAGFRLALLTNDNEVSAQQNLSDLGVATLFSTVVGADSGHGAKPEPGGLLYCCAANGVDPAQALMIGDTRADYGAAISAGVADFICIADDVDARPDPAIKPENVIPDLTALPELLLRRKDTLLRRNEG
jgi:phosphoglycolate phosphatase